jgi:starvation-inducible DNA-binding protein
VVVELTVKRFIQLLSFFIYRSHLLPMVRLSIKPNQEIMESKIGIEQKSLEKISFELSKVLASEFVLYVKTKNAHWNVEGVDFYSKHKFFESQFDSIDEIIDELAERIRSLGHYAPGSMRKFLQLTKLSESIREANDSNGFMKELLIDHEGIILHLREIIDPFASEFGDAGTSDFVTALLQKHEKMAWMLRSHLK